MSILLNKTPHFGCGTGIFFLKNEKEFFAACQLHDIEYDLRGPLESRAESDRIFLRRMLALGDGGVWDTVRAYGYYLIVRAFGRYYWKRKAFYSDDDLATYHVVLAMEFGEQASNREQVTENNSGVQLISGRWLRVVDSCLPDRHRFSTFHFLFSIFPIRGVHHLIIDQSDDEFS